MSGRRSCPSFRVENLTVRDATLEDIQSIKIKNSSTKFFGSHNIEIRFKSSIYSFYLENPEKKFAGYATFECKPNLNAIHPAYWVDWIRKFYDMPEVTYGNTVFMTFLQLYDPFNNSILKALFQEVFLREPKVKFICIVTPPIDSIYEDVLMVHCRCKRSLDESESRLCQSLFYTRRYDVIPKMRFRRALAEDNDDLVEIIDEKLPSIRRELGDFYIAEMVLRNDRSENIVVAEINHVTVGMIWLNTNIHQKVLADNFETNAYGNFIRPQRSSENIDTRIVKGIVRRPSEIFFDPPTYDVSILDRKSAQEKRLSMNNLYIASTDSIQTAASITSIDNKNIFRRWEKIGKILDSADTYIDEVIKSVKAPKSLEMTNAFVIQLFGLTKKVDPRRYFDLVAAAFASYKDKDYCLISLSSSEASSDAISGYLLRFFSCVVPRSGCKISDCLYVTHRNSFTLEITVDFITNDQDCNDIKNLLDTSVMQGKGIYYMADIMQIMNAFVFHGWAQDTVLIMRSGGCCIGFAVLRQNTMMSELAANYKLYDDDDAFPEWKVGELHYLLLHPVFVWEWVHVSRQIFRLTNFFSMYFKFTAEWKIPILNSLLMSMFPIFPRNRIKSTKINSYSLYYLNIKMCHLYRDQIARKLVIIGFNETCKGFLRSLFYSSSSKDVQCLNLTIVTRKYGTSAAEHDIKSFERLYSLFYGGKNQFTPEYMRCLEFRTWVRFIPGRIEGILSQKKRINFSNGTTLRYDRLYLMCSTRYSRPKPFLVAPTNYIEINNRLDAITFYLKIKLLVKDVWPDTCPILIYGEVAMAHACIQELLVLGVKPSLIHLVITSSTVSERPIFPESFDDEYVSDLIHFLEQRAGLKILTGLSFVDWKLYETENVIESVTFKSAFQLITIKCMAFISYHGQPLSNHLVSVFTASGLEMRDGLVVIDEFSKTSLPFVYAAGRITTYREDLFAKELEQCYFNQVDIGNKLATNLIKHHKTGEELSIIDAQFLKPVFRQFELIEGITYGALRTPGRYISRCVKKNFKNSGTELITSDEKEYCRVILDELGFICDITCLTQKYKRLDVLYRVYNLHESMLNNLKLRFQNGEVKCLLEYFNSDVFAVILHDQFFDLKTTIRRNNLNCIADLLKDIQTGQINRDEIEGRLHMKGMNNTIREEVYKFIKKHWKSLHPHYALPEDFHFQNIL